MIVEKIVRDRKMEYAISKVIISLDFSEPTAERVDQEYVNFR